MSTSDEQPLGNDDSSTPVERSELTGRTARQEQLVEWRYYLEWAINDAEQQVSLNNLMAKHHYRHLPDVLREIAAALAVGIAEEEAK